MVQARTKRVHPASGPSEAITGAALQTPPSGSDRFVKATRVVWASPRRPGVLRPPSIHADSSDRGSAVRATQYPECWGIRKIFHPIFKKNLSTDMH